MKLLGPQDLKKKYQAQWALVTGGSSGIGRAIVDRLALQGLNVCVVSIDDDLLKNTVKELKAAFPKQVGWCGELGGEGGRGREERRKGRRAGQGMCMYKKKLILFVPILTLPSSLIPSLHEIGIPRRGGPLLPRASLPAQDHYCHQGH